MKSTAQIVDKTDLSVNVWRVKTAIAYIWAKNMKHIRFIGFISVFVSYLLTLFLSFFF